MADAYVTGTGGLPILQNAELGERIQGFRPPNLLTGERYRSLDFRQSFFDCTQHDWKVYDFSGAFVGNQSMGAGASPMLAMPGAAVPLQYRRPSAPYRLAPTIVKSFTAFVFGEDRFPIISCAEDIKTDDFAKTIALEGRLAWHMMRARNLGGSMGTVGLSWCFQNGKPRFDVHNAKNIHVFDWSDRSELIPSHVAEVYPYFRVEWNGKEYANHYYWFRRDWLPNADIVFKDVPYEKGKDPVWVIDEERSKQHDDGVIHFEWVQNQPSESIDGLPDYHGCYDQLNVLDIIASIVSRGGIANLDPTLVLGIDPELANRVGIRKGSDNFLAVGQGGSAQYLELAGSSIDTGLKLQDYLRREILESSQCVIPDPSTVASQGISSVSQKMLYAPTTSCAQMLREQYGTAMERMLRNMIEVSRKYVSKSVVAVDVETGVETPAKLTIDLPPKIEKEDVIDPVTGKVTGETLKKIPREPGEGTYVRLGWHAWFPATFQDQTAYAQMLGTATGGKAFMSRETAIELGANVFGYEASQEKKKIASQSEQESSEQAAMFPAMGGVEDGDTKPVALSERLAEKEAAPKVEEEPESDPENPTST